MKSKIYDYTKEDLQKLLDVSNSYGDILEKIGLNRRGGNPEVLKRIIKEYELNELTLNRNRQLLSSKRTLNANFKTTIPLNEILVKDSTYKNNSKLLKKLYKAKLKEPQCEVCKIKDWNNEKISFQLHHKDGNSSNNEIENLQVLCPNCHSQTNNFAGRKIKKIKIKKERESKIIPKEDLKSLIRNNSFTYIGKKYNLTDNAIRKWCKKYDLPYTKAEIKKYTDEQWKNI